MAEIALLVGGGLMAASEIQAGRIAAAQGRTQQKIAEYNAKQLERQAKAKKSIASIESDRLSRQQTIINAANRAKAGKSSISMSESPSTVEVLADVAFQFHLDRNFILNQGMQDYLDLNAQASLLRAEGAFAKVQGKQEQQASYLSAGATMFSAMGTYFAPKPPPSVMTPAQKTSAATLLRY